jgi:hypothetical protein
MKKITLLLFLYLLQITFIHAQTPPNAFNYSAVARNASGQPIANSTVGIQISILKTSTVGTTVYRENHAVNTDAFGLFNLVIGAGSIQTGSMATINWGNDNYYLKVGMDATGGTNFLTMGTTQLLTVPYALYAKSAGTVTNSNDNDTSATNELQVISLKNDTIFLTNGGFVILPTKITISSISSAGDTLYLSNGQRFVAGGNTGGSGSLVLPTITTNAVTGITSNSATFGGAISNAISYQIFERGIVFSTSPKPTLASNNIVLGNGIGTFDTITGLGAKYNHLLKSNTTYYVRAYAVTENNITIYGNEVSFTTLSVGQTGPAGGIVFFDKGSNSGGWRYLEAATSDQSTGIAWGCYGTSIPGTQFNVGSGETNTSLIVAGCSDASFAAKLCDNLTLGGQSDWFLPSRDELNLMYKNLYTNGQGGFVNNISYWSSTEAHYIYFGNGDTNVGYKLDSYIVRAVRAF